MIQKLFNHKKNPFLNSETAVQLLSIIRQQKYLPAIQFPHCL